MSHPEKFSSIEAILEQLESNRYIADQLLATVIYLSHHMHKPICRFPVKAAEMRSPRRRGHPKVTIFLSFIVFQ